MVKHQFIKGRNSSKKAYNPDVGKLSFCGPDQRCCCPFNLQLGLWAHWVCDPGCVEFSSCIGTDVQLDWLGTGPGGVCDHWQYQTTPDPQLLQCADPPGPALLIDHRIDLTCNPVDEWRVEVCMSEGGVPPAWVPGDSCDFNIFGLEGEVTQVCNPTTHPTDPGNLYIDFGVIEFPSCPSGCGWRLIIDTQPGAPAAFCPNCTLGTPTDVMLTITGFAENFPCGKDCENYNGSFGLNARPGFPCIHDLDIGVICGQTTRLEVEFTPTGWTAMIIRDATAEVVAGATVTGGIVDCNATLNSPNTELGIGNCGPLGAVAFQIN